MTSPDSAIEALSRRFAVPGAVAVELSPLGGPVVRLAHGGATAAVALQGGQVLEWRPAGHQPALWLSQVSRLDAPKPVRGGVPVCWPWFGPQPADPEALASTPGAGWMQHGFARVSPWRIEATGADARAASVVLSFATAGDGVAGWPHAAEARLTVRLGNTLDLALATRNTGSRAFVLTQALHTYFRVGDISATRIERLEGHAFHDAVVLGAAREVSRTLSSQTGPVGFESEVNRIYIEQRGPVSILDRALGRRIEIDKRGSASTVVWNPWAANAAALGDMGDGGWRQMVCVETANTVYDPVRLAPGGVAELGVGYRAARL